MAAAPASAGIAASQTEFRKSALKLTQSMKSLNAPREAGHSAARAQQKAVARRSHWPGTTVAIKPTTNALAAASMIQPYQYIGGPSTGMGRYTQNSVLPALGR